LKGFTLLEILIATSLSLIIATSIFQLIAFTQKRYEVASSITQINQKASLVRDILERSIRKVTNFEGHYSGRSIGDVLVLNYVEGNRCDGQPLKEDASQISDYLFIVKEIVKKNKQFNLKCKVPGRDISPLVSNIKNMAITYHESKANATYLKIEIIVTDKSYQRPITFYFATKNE
jgi:prepilin-type N-terminal cleavage/methylation domain-containing protein